MIPEHLIDKAETAAIEQWGRTGDWDAALIAALEAVAADIWDEGEKAGYIGGQHDAHRWDPDEDNYEDPPNPYRASETA